MLLTIALVLAVLWLLGAFVFPIGGGLIHLILVIAIVVLVVNFMRGRGARL